MNKNYIINEKGILKQYTGNEETITIPSNVRTIELFSFANKKFIKKVIIPKNVKIISMFAFVNCPNIEELII